MTSTLLAEEPINRIDTADLALSGGTSRKFTIPGDVINMATADLPDAQRSLIRWLAAHCTERDISAHGIAAKLKQSNGKPYDGNTVYKIFTGKHEASLANFVSAVEDFKKDWEEKKTILRVFVITALTKRIWEVCDSARIYQKIAFILAASQVGKTTALQEYARRNNHGETIYVRMPAGGNKRDFIMRLADQLHISRSENWRSLLMRIMNAIDDRMLLIVDEFHQLSVGSVKADTLELIRDIVDTCKCGCVLCGTHLDPDLVDGKYKKLFSQTDLRALCKCVLPNKPGKGDLNAFAEAFGLSHATGEALDLQKEIIRDFGLGRWCTILQAGSRMASKGKRNLTWNDVLNAQKAFVSLESGEL
jgi:DNA transposition AAA+ family ATPase